ncbi:S8 family peptidase [Peribacillus sp. NPDC097225]|uniref:S8 family peptidase n=1 Tax=Peribacillus sp. NPDC097225 TaxID=3364400 RepID=UPI00381A35FE
MKRMFSLLVIIAFCIQIGVGNGPPTLAAEQANPTAIETDRVIVKMKPSAKEGSLKKYKVSEKTIDQQGLLKTMEVPDDTSLVGFIRKLEKDKNIEYVEPDHLIQLMKKPSDPHYTKQYHHKLIQTEKAWDKTKGSKSIIVAVIDNGADLNHPDLKGKFFAPYNMVNLSPHLPAGEHGTHVAGIIAATMNNGAGGTGVAPNTRIMPINIFRGEYGYSSDLIYAIYYAVEYGANIINMSLGGFNYSYSEDQAIQYAHDMGLVIVAAAGNEDTYWNSYPASYENVISVSATSKKDRIADYSNYGTNIDLAAPGDSIYSTLPYKSYGYMTGTSMAAPIVTGVAALVWGNKPTLKNTQVEERLFSTSDDLGKKGKDDLYGNGRVNAKRAVNYVAKPTVHTVKDNAKTITGKAEKGSTVTVKKGSSQLGKAKTNSAGTFKVTMKTKQKAGTKLSVTAKSKAGYSSKARTVTVVKAKK